MLDRQNVSLPPRSASVLVSTELFRCMTDVHLAVFHPDFEGMGNPGEAID